MNITTNKNRRPDGTPARRRIDLPKIIFGRINISDFRLKINAIIAAAKSNGGGDAHIED